ncbi:hypothetical protein ACEPAI_7122 [Sanghuangporus weigelae]
MSFFKKLGAKVQEGIVRTSDTIEGAHGFSALIETQVEGSEPHTILFDTGPDSKSIIRNVESMQVNTRRYVHLSSHFRPLPHLAVPSDAMQPPGPHLLQSVAKR